MYHVADGSYYSSDLRDGQFVPSLLSDQEIQVGVRVDGCSRKLLNQNNLQNQLPSFVSFHFHGVMVMAQVDLLKQMLVLCIERTFLRLMV